MRALCFAASSAICSGRRRQCFVLKQRIPKRVVERELMGRCLRICVLCGLKVIFHGRSVEGVCLTVFFENKLCKHNYYLPILACKFFGKSEFYCDYSVSACLRGWFYARFDSFVAYFYSIYWHKLRVWGQKLTYYTLLFPNIDIEFFWIGFG